MLSERYGEAAAEAKNKGKALLEKEALLDAVMAQVSQELSCNFEVYVRMAYTAIYLQEVDPSFRAADPFVFLSTLFCLPYKPCCIVFFFALFLPFPADGSEDGPRLRQSRARRGEAVLAGIGGRGKVTTTVRRVGKENGDSLLLAFPACAVGCDESVSCPFDLGLFMYGVQASGRQSLVQYFAVCVRWWWISCKRHRTRCNHHLLSQSK